MLRKINFLALLILLAPLAFAQTKINPSTGIDWPDGCELYDAATDTCVSASGSYTLPIAQPATLGGIKPDNTTITVNASTGVASATGGAGNPASPSGSKQFNNAGTFGGNSYTLDATAFSGADMGAKITAAMAALPVGIGTVDATGFACPGACHIGTANLIVPSYVTLILPTGTITRDTITATGLSAQIYYSSYSTITGQGKGVTVVSGPNDVPAFIQTYGSGSSAALKGFSISGGSPALEIGGPNANIPFNSAPNVTLNSSVIGSNYGSNGVNGRLAHFAIYRTALSDAQIANHYAVGNAAGSTYVATVEADSPLAYWPLTEASGTTAVELISGRNATYVGSPTLGSSGGIPGDSGSTAVDLNGTTQWIDLPSYNWLDGDYTLEGWGYFNVNYGAQTLYILQGSGVYTEVYDWTTNTGFGLHTNYGSGADQPQVSMGSGVWSYFAITYHNGGVLFYLNGQLIRTGTDVDSSTFTDISASGSPEGVLMTSEHGCICYNDIKNVDATGSTYGALVNNASGYAFGVNANKWTGGKMRGPIGFMESGAVKNTYTALDFENNQTSTGAILYATTNYANLGSGYVLGDTFRPAGGSSNAVFTVTSVSGSAVTGFSITTPGTSYTNAQYVATTALTGIGVGLQVDIVVSAYQLLTGSGGSMIVNPYEENGGTDYLCGTGYTITGAWGSGNGSLYTPVYCNQPSNQYGGPASNFVWGSASVPSTIGVGSGVLFRSGQMYDDGYNSNLLLYNPYGTAQLELIYAGGNTNIYGRAGHAPLIVGGMYNFGGTAHSGRFTQTTLANPSAPSIVNVGTTGSTTYQYRIYCQDFNSGTSAESSTGQTATGSATLNGTNYNQINYTCADGYYSSVVAKFSGGTWQTLAAFGNQSHGGTGSTSVLDQGQSLSAYFAPSGNTTGDFLVNSSKVCTVATGCGASGTVSSGTAGQIAHYGSTGTTVSGTNALDNGTTATTQSPGDNTTKVATDAFVIANAGGGSGTAGTIINVTSYGAIPDASTNNKTAFGSAATALAAVTNGIPTLYFPCAAVSGSPSCQYNCADAGTTCLTLNNAKGFSVKCDQGVTINDTGSGHIIQVGDGATNYLPYSPATIDGCQFVSTTASAAIYAKSGTAVIEPLIVKNSSFILSSTSTAILGDGGNIYHGIILNNIFQPAGDASGTFVDLGAGDGQNNQIFASFNSIYCGQHLTSCTAGAGFKLYGYSVITNNFIEDMNPDILCVAGPGDGQGCSGSDISNNNFETSIPGSLAIQIGTTGDSGKIVSGLDIHGNISSLHFSTASFLGMGSSTDTLQGVTLRANKTWQLGSTLITLNNLIGQTGNISDGNMCNAAYGPQTPCALPIHQTPGAGATFEPWLEEDGYNFSDTFNTNGALTAPYFPSTSLPATSVTSHVLTCTSTCSIKSALDLPANQLNMVQISTVPTSAGFVQVFSRYTYSTNTNFMACAYVQGSGIELYKDVTGTVTQLGSFYTTITPLAGDWLGIKSIGTLHECILVHAGVSNIVLTASDSDLGVGYGGFGQSTTSAISAFTIQGLP